MRLLLTGVCGFIGRQIARQAHADGIEVHGFDLDATAPHDLMLASYAENSGGCAVIDQLVDDTYPDLCIHAAGRASVADSIASPATDYNAGPALTFAILDSLRRRSPQCRFVFLSSAAVYGNPETSPITERQQLSPISPYGFHKYQSELICQEFSNIYGLHTSIVRIFSAFGDGLRRQVLWEICRQLDQTGALYLRGTGNETRDFLHVKDVARGALLVATLGQGNCRAYNLASGRETSVRELAMIASLAFQPPARINFDGIVPVGDPLRWCADISQISELGFQPIVTLEHGVYEYANWCREHWAT